MPSSSSAAISWTLLIPVKETTIAKSRLGGIPNHARQRLALAFALDTVSAALACPHVNRVVVVSNDVSVGRFTALGAQVVPDVPARGLNAALLYAAERTTLHPSSSLAALQSDLPALRPEDLSAVLADRLESRWFVPDSVGTGTTMLAARAGHRWQPRFGENSRAAHLALGMVEVITPDLPRLRRDVDTLADLRVAQELGVGAHTSQALADLNRSRLP